MAVPGRWTYTTYEIECMSRLKILTSEWRYSREVSDVDFTLKQDILEKKTLSGATPHYKAKYGNLIRNKSDKTHMKN